MPSRNQLWLNFDDHVAGLDGDAGDRGNLGQLLGIGDGHQCRGWVTSFLDLVEIDLGKYIAGLDVLLLGNLDICLLYTSPSPRD